MKSAKTVFVLLMVSTLAAFFIAQRLKQSPELVQSIKYSEYFSPNSDRRHDLARISFKLKEDDEVTATVVNSNGDSVKELVSDRYVKAYRRLKVTWDGLDNSGKRAPDGEYKLRLGLNKQGRSVTLPDSIKLDTTAPEPSILKIGPSKDAGPEILPHRDGSTAVRIYFRGSKQYVPQFYVYRTYHQYADRLVAKFNGQAGKRSVVWDGIADFDSPIAKTEAGKPLPSGTYRVVVKVRDRAGNIGSNNNLKVGSKNKPNVAKLLANAGITVRPLAVAVPYTPTAGGHTASVRVDARGNRYRWKLTRLGAEKPTRSGSSKQANLKIAVPKGDAGVYLLQLVSEGHTVTAPLTVTTPQRHERVLIVLPATSFINAMPGDFDGDGLDDTLDGFHPPITLSTQRSYTEAKAPTAINAELKPLLELFDKRNLRYDITTDLALAAGKGPDLKQYHGVILPSSFTWTPKSFATKLKRFVRKGGRVLSLGTDTLLRTVQFNPKKQQLYQPGQAQIKDIFGIEVNPTVKAKGGADMLAFPKDRLNLFAGTDGLYSGWDSYQSRAASSWLAAAGSDAKEPSILAKRFGKGVVFEIGLPQWSSRIGSDRNVTTTTRRIWNLIGKQG